MSNGKGPPDKWVKFSTEGMGSDDVLLELNKLAAQGFSSAAVSVSCTDGLFVFVGGYSQDNG